VEVVHHSAVVWQGVVVELLRSAEEDEDEVRGVQEVWQDVLASLLLPLLLYDVEVRFLVPYVEIWDEEGVQDELVEEQVQSALEKEVEEVEEEEGVFEEQ